MAMENNLPFRALFTLPPISPSSSTAVAVPEIPLQVAVTGDSEVDAVLWLQQVVKIGNQGLIDKALEAAKRIKTPMKVLGERYAQYRRHQGGHPLEVAFASFGFGDLEDQAKRAIQKAKDRHEAISRFGTAEALLIDTPAEAACIAACGRMRENRAGFIDEAVARKRLLAKPDLIPATISDCLLALEYWDDIYRLRNASIENLGDSNQVCMAHEWLCFGRMAEIAPQSGAEAIAVFDYLEASDRMGQTEVPAILRNLIASGWQTQTT